MSGGDWKKPFLRVAQIDSQNLKHLGQDWNLPWLENEAAHNEKNPGRAITKAAEYAAMWYAGGLLGGTEGSVGAGATDAAESGGTLALDAAGNAVPYVAQGAVEAADPAVQLAADPSLWESLKSGASAAKDAVTQGTNSIKSGWNSIKEVPKAITSTVDKGLYQAVPGVGSEQAGLLAQQTGDFGAYGLGKTMESAASADGLSAMQQAMGNYGGKAMELLGKGGDASQKFAKAQQVMGLLNPQQQRQPMPMGAPPPRQQADTGPLSTPYQSNPYGPGGNSMGLLGLSEEEKLRKLRAMGYQV
jgi:hypothetical protein